MDRRARGGAAPSATAQPPRDGGILRRLARHVAAPPQLTATVRWIFTIIERSAPPRLEWLTVLAVMTTAVLWYRSYRRGRYGGWDGAVDALALILVAMTPGTAMAGSGLLIARGQIRSLYGSPRGKLLHAAAGSACLALGLLLSTAPADRAVLRLLLVTLVLFTFAAFRPGRAGPGRRGRTHPTRPGRTRR